MLMRGALGTAFDYVEGLSRCAFSLAENALRLKGRLGQMVPAASEDTPHPAEIITSNFLLFSFLL